MTTYIGQQFAKAKDLSSGDVALRQFRLQIVGPVSCSNWLGLNRNQLDRIEAIMLEGELEELPPHLAPLNELRNMILACHDAEEASQMKADINELLNGVLK